MSQKTRLPWWGELGVQILLIGLSLTAMHFTIKALDPYKEQKEAARKKVALMRRRLGRELELNEYEVMVATGVINPAEIDITSDDICGMEELKLEVMRKVLVPLQQTATYSTTLLKPAKGVLLYGPPGTGKTMLAKAMARQCECFFLTITTSSILSKYLGDSSRMVRAIFTLAYKLQPCIIFIDEVEALMGKRGQGGEHEATLQVKTEFMQHWEGLETGAGRVLVMGATNRPHMIDEAILRRFSQQYEVPLPNQRQREAILLGYLKKHNNETLGHVPTGHVSKSGGVSMALLENREVAGSSQGKAPLTWLASKTEGYSGSDLRELCSQAAQNVLADSINAHSWDHGQTIPSGSQHRMVDLSDFIKALSHVKPSSLKAMEFERTSSTTSAGPHPQISSQDIQLFMEMLKILGGRGPSSS